MPEFYTVTIFEHTKNSKGKRASVSWGNFKGSMRAYASQEQPTKSSCQQISGNSFKDDTRRKANAEFMNIAFVDIDNKEIPEDEKISIHGALAALEGIEALIVTSWSHEENDPRFRVMIPLADPVPCKKFRPVMYDIFQRIFKGSAGVDPGSYKNMALPYYLPCNNAEVIDLPGNTWIPREMEEPKKITESCQIAYIARAGMSNYLKAVIKNNQDDIRSAGTAGRNNALNRASYSLGRIVAAGLLNLQEVTAILRNEAITCGLMSEDGHEAVAATIESGLKSGMERPANVRALNTDNIFKRGK